MKKTEDKKGRILQLHQNIVQRIFKKIPVLEEEREVYLQVSYFKLLDDEEFVTLWSLPNLVIRVDLKAAEYIEERRKLLGLTRSMQNGVMSENKST